MEASPFKWEVTSMGIPAMGTSPMFVLATTSAAPLSSTSRSGVSVTPAKSCWKAPLLSDCRATSVKLMSRSTRLPVEIPPLAGAFGRTSCMQIYGIHGSSLRGESTYPSDVDTMGAHDDGLASLNYLQRKSKGILVSSHCVLRAGRW